MKNEINKVIQQAIKEDWFNNMTTSDLQGVCEAQAMNIFNDYKNSGKPYGVFEERAIRAISEEILQGIYK